MLDERTKMMLESANTLSAEDLDLVRSIAAPGRATPVESVASHRVAPPEPPVNAEPPKTTRKRERQANAGVSRGARERQRTRESKVSTVCVGQERVKHEWWPVDTDLVGHIGAEAFTARVVENPQVKSGRSLLITSGTAQGQICITPTRAAIEATEAHRQALGLGRSGGVTNGWTFWQPSS